jgi:hypothetical protein
MAGYLVQQNATVVCPHGGSAHPLAPSPRVRLSGSPVTTQTVPWVIGGCTNTTPGPCLTAQWTTGAARVKSLGQPVLLASSLAMTVPIGVPLRIDTTQTRAKGR